jgi:hypothetical protein
VTQTSHSEVKSMTEHEYRFLTDTWDGVKGAAYNACYEFCRDFGWCDTEGRPTSAGHAAIQLYEMEKWNL